MMPIWIFSIISPVINVTWYIIIINVENIVEIVRGGGGFFNLIESSKEHYLLFSII